MTLGDAIINEYYAAKERNGWRGETRMIWELNRDAVRLLVKQKNSDGVYLYRISTKRGARDSFLGLPVEVTESASGECLNHANKRKFARALAENNLVVVDYV